MRIVTGRICRLLHNSSDKVNGFVLDSGVGVHFPPDCARSVLAIATVNSRVEVSGRIRSWHPQEAHVDADRIANLDSRKSASLYSSAPPQSPEVSAECPAPPNSAEPLAPLSDHSGPRFSEHAGLRLDAIRKGVTDEIEHAYDRLHRTQVMLAYLKMIDQETGMVAQYSDEAKHTYVQALSRYQDRDFEGARELAAASNGLSRLVEILVSKAFHSITEHPKPVSPSLKRTCNGRDNEAVQHDLDRIEGLLARVQWVTQHGTMPSDDRAQVERLSSWGERLCRWARRLLEIGSTEDGTEFAQAADAAVYSAEHLCRKCYVTRTAGPRSAVAPN